MAALAQTHSHDFSFDSSGNFTTPAYDTTGDTWLVLIINNFNAPATVAGITALTYNGVSFLANLTTTGVTGHNGTDNMGVAWMNLGANAGNHTFNIQWPGGGNLDFQVISGNGDLDAATLDVSPTVSSETASAPAYTPAPITPGITNALPIIATWGNGPSISATSGCTRIIESALDPGAALFTCPLSTSGVPTAAVMDTGSPSFWLTISFSLKPTGGGGGTIPTPFFARLLGNGSSL
jgi:hypothetical protein